MGGKGHEKGAPVAGRIERLAGSSGALTDLDPGLNPSEEGEAIRSPTLIEDLMNGFVVPAS